jgi:hypothetical protein
MENEYQGYRFEREVLPFYNCLSNEELVEVYNEVILEQYGRAHAKTDKRIILAIIKYVLCCRNLNCDGICFSTEIYIFSITDLDVYVSCCIDGYLEDRFNTSDIIKLEGTILIRVGSPPLPKSSSDNGY